MKHVYPLMLLAAVGCFERTVVLSYFLKTPRFDEASAPMAFAIPIANEGYEVGEIKSVKMGVASEWLIASPGDALPDRFHYSLEVSKDHPAHIRPRSEGVACGFLVWKLPPDSPPMVAVVTCLFEVEVDDVTLSTGPVTLVLQSQKGLLTETVSSNDSPLRGEQASKVLAELRNMPGEKSAGFENLVEQLERESDTVAAEQ